MNTDNSPKPTALGPTPRGRLISVLLGLSVLAGCATTSPPSRYQGLASASKLSATDDGHDIVFAYKTHDGEWAKYTHYVLDPVEVYEGPDGQFGSASAEDKAELADYMRAQFDEVLKSRYRKASTARAGALRVHLTLTGMESNTAVLSTLVNVIPVGLLVNGVKSATGAQATFSGSVSYAVEIYDGATDRLLRAYVTKKYPMAVDISASLGALDAAKAGIRSGAVAMLEQMH